MSANLTHRLLLTLTATVIGLAILVAGCGKEDLYQPPGSPYEVIGHLPLPSLNEGLAVLDNTVYVAGGEAGLHTIDWSNPANPVLLATINTTKFAEDIQVTRTFDGGVMRDIAHVVEGTEGVTSFDVTDPANPVDYETGTTAVFGRTVFIAEDVDPSKAYVVYLAESWKGVRIFESVTGDPGILAYNGVFVGTNGQAYHLVVRDGWGYCADNEMGLCVLDLRVLDLNSVTLTSWADTPGSARFVALQGDYALVADGVEGLAVFRINEGDTPVKVAQYDLSGFSESIALRDGLCALAGNTGGVHFMDVTDPTNPVYLGTTATPNATDVVFTEDGHCLVMDEETGFYVLAGRGAFSDIKAPAPVSDLAAEPFSRTEIDLIWTVTGDDRMRGTATSQEIRYALHDPDVEPTWESAAPLAGVPAPEAPGTSMTYQMTGLEPGTAYDVAIVVTDDAGYASPVPAFLNVETPLGIVLSNPALNIIGGTDSDTYVYSIEARWPLEFIETQVVIDGVAETMTTEDGLHFRYSTNHVAGSHTYRFNFTADDIDPATTDEEVGPLVGALPFVMGSPEGEPGRGDDEPEHIVVLAHDLVAGAHEVTQSEWDDVMPPGSNPSTFPGANRPVDSVTWLDALHYCNARSLAEDPALEPVYVFDDDNLVDTDFAASGWRLPTEAEWEYLCRAGTSTALYNGHLLNLNCLVDPNLDAIGWYCGNATGGPAVGEQKLPNALNLYDMSGNLREWCFDWYAPLASDPALAPEGPEFGEEKVVRGGSWYYQAQECRSAARGTFPPDSPDNTIGMRVVRSVVED